MKKETSMNIWFFLLIFLWSGCTSNHDPLVFQNKPPVTISDSQYRLPGSVSSTPGGDRLEFKVSIPNFKTQAVNTAQIKYIKLWVFGPGMETKIWNDNGYVPVNGSMTLRIEHVPKGKNRVVAAIGYDANKMAIPGAVVKAVYTSPPEQNVTVTLVLKWRYVPLADILEYLMQFDPALAQSLDTTTLQNTLDTILYGLNPVGGNTFAIHPSQLNPTVIAKTLQSGILPLPNNPPAEWIPPLVSTEIVVQNFNGQPSGDAFQVAIADPSSSTKTISAGSDRVTFNNIAPGTWNVTVYLASDNSLVGQTTLTVKQDGSVTLGQGSVGNPFKIAPYIASRNGPDPAVQAPGLVSWWQAEGTANDRIGDNGGLLKNGATYAAGMVGQAFFFDLSSSQFIDLGTPTSLNTGITDMTLAAWVKLDANLGTAITNHEIFSNESYQNYGYLFRVENKNVPASAGKIHFRTSQAGASTYVTAVAQSYPNDHNFHYLVATKNGTVGKIFLDGQALPLLDNQAMNNPVNSLTTAKIGGSGQYWDGMIDELQIYNRALTEAEILAEYKTKSTTLSGYGYASTPTGNMVKFAATTATVTGASNTSLSVTVPSTIFGIVPLNVTVGGQISNTINFTTIPTIASLSQQLALPGDTITIAGTGFNPTPGNNMVKFNETAATVTGATTTTLTVTVPIAITKGAVTVGTAVGPDFTPAPSGLVSWWKADGNAQEPVGSNHGTLVGNTGFAPGKHGQSFGLDGAGDYITHPVLSLTSGAFTGLTFSAWVKTSSIDSSSTYAGNAALNVLGDSQFSVWIGFGVHGGKVRYNHYTGVWDNVTGVTSVNDGKWHQIAVTHNRGTGAISLYVDGNTDVAGNIAYAGVNPAVNRIGAGYSNFDCFDGFIDEVQIYNRALSAAEIQANYDATK